MQPNECFGRYPSGSIALYCDHCKWVNDCEKDTRATLVPDLEGWCPTCENVTLHTWMYVYLANGQRHYFHSCLTCQSTQRFEFGVTVGDVVDQRRYHHQITPFEGWSNGGEDRYADLRTDG